MVAIQLSACSALALIASRRERAGLLGQSVDCRLWSAGLVDRELLGQIVPSLVCQRAADGVDEAGWQDAIVGEWLLHENRGAVEENLGHTGRMEKQQRLAPIFQRETWRKLADVIIIEAREHFPEINKATRERQDEWIDFLYKACRSVIECNDRVIQQFQEWQAEQIARQPLRIALHPDPLRPVRQEIVGFEPGPNPPETERVIIQEYYPAMLTGQQIADYRERVAQAMQRLQENRLQLAAALPAAPEAAAGTELPAPPGPESV